jgi:hypothetical protein
MTNIDQRPTSSDAESAASSGAAGPRAAAPRAKQRSTLRTVALPSEHGGWGLTLEPVLLGLLVAHSVSAFCIGLAAVLAFLARTPLKLAVVDARRGRTLERTRMARKVAAAELAVLAVLVVVAFLTATPGFWWPIFGIAPLLLVELSYDIRSRSRRLIPELAGAVGIAGVAAMMALAGGLDTAVALGLWAVLAGRAIAAIPTIRSQVLKLHGRPTNDGPAGRRRPGGARPGRSDRRRRAGADRRCGRGGRRHRCPAGPDRVGSHRTRRRARHPPDGDGTCRGDRHRHRRGPRLSHIRSRPNQPFHEEQQ